MRIGAVSERLGVPASTIRYYERIGLLERQRRVAGRRVFDERALFALKFVQLAQAAGFSIAETRALLESRADDPSLAALWQPFATAKRTLVRRQIRDLKRMDRILTALLSCECATLVECVESYAEGPRIRRPGKTKAAGP